MGIRSEARSRLDILNLWETQAPSPRGAQGLPGNGFRTQSASDTRCVGFPHQAIPQLVGTWALQVSSLLTPTAGVSAAHRLKTQKPQTAPSLGTSHKTPLPTLPSNLAAIRGSHDLSAGWKFATTFHKTQRNTSLCVCLS